MDILLDVNGYLVGYERISSLDMKCYPIHIHWHPVVWFQPLFMDLSCRSSFHIPSYPVISTDIHRSYLVSIAIYPFISIYFSRPLISKAFDSVSRDCLLVVLDKFGITPKMKRLIMKFHSDLVVTVLVGKDDVCFESSSETGMSNVTNSFWIIIPGCKWECWFLSAILLYLVQIQEWRDFHWT